MKSKVTLFVNNLNDKNNLRTLTSWAEILIRADYAITILTYYPVANEPTFDKKIVRANLIATYEEYTQLTYKRLMCQKSLKAYLIEHPQDLIIPFGINCNLLAAITAQENSNIITQTQFKNTDVNEQPFEAVLADWAIQKRGSVILQNNEQLKSFQSRSLKQVKKYIIPQSILNPDLKSICKKDYQSIKKIVAVGRLSAEKNYALMIDTIRILRDEYHEKYCLDIYGDGDLKDELQTQIDTLGLTQQIKICTDNSEIYQKLINYDLFITATLSNTTHKTLLEAMSLGLPSLAIKTEIIKDNNNGYVIEQDNAAVLAKKIHTINSAEQLTRIGKQARLDILTHYGTQQMQDKLIETIEDLIANPYKKTHAIIPACRLSTQTQSQNYFETSLNFMRIANYTLCKQIFKHARRTLKKAQITVKPNSLQKAYQVCLKHNQFEIFYEYLHYVTV